MTPTAQPTQAPQAMPATSQLSPTAQGADRSEALKRVVATTTAILSSDRARIALAQAPHAPRTLSLDALSFEEARRSLPPELRGLLEAMAADPAALLMGLQCRLRDQQSELLRTQASDAASQREALHDEKMKAMEKACNAESKAASLLGWMPPALRQVLKVVVVIAAAAATALTGGAAAGLALAGAALILGAEPLSQLAVKLGWLEEKDARWLKLGLEVVGSLLMAGAGIAAVGGNAANAARACASLTKACKTVTSAVRIVGAVDGVAQGISEGGAAAFRHVANRAELRADALNLELDVQSEKIEAATDDLREELQAFARCARHLHEVVRTQGEARLAAARALA